MCCLFKIGYDIYYQISQSSSYPVEFEQVLTKQVMLDYQNRRLTYFRIYTFAIASLYAVMHLTMFMLDKYNAPAWIRAILDTMTGVTLVAVFLSYYFTLNTIYFAVSIL